MAGLVEETWVSVTVLSVAGEPLRVSLARTSVTAVPPAAPEATEPLSAVATTGAEPTVTLTVPLSQLLGLSCSQIE